MWWCGLQKHMCASRFPNSTYCNHIHSDSLLLLLLPLQLMEGQLDEWMDAFHTMLAFSHPGLAAADAAGAHTGGSGGG